MTPKLINKPHTIYLDDATWETIMRLANLRNHNYSVVIRDCINDYVALQVKANLK